MLVYQRVNPMPKTDPQMSSVQNPVWPLLNWLVEDRIPRSWIVMIPNVFVRKIFELIMNQPLLK